MCDFKSSVHKEGRDVALAFAICLVVSNSQRPAMSAAMSSLLSEVVRTLTFITTPTASHPHRVPYELPLTMHLPVFSLTFGCSRVSCPCRP